MSWFGWLTKSRCEISALDGFILLGELTVIVVIALGIEKLLNRLGGRK